MSLGNNIKKYRHDLGITQEELAGILCITSQAEIKNESNDKNVLVCDNDSY